MILSRERGSFTFLSAIVAVLLLIIPSARPVNSAGTPQGKGGEVIAKPTPTPTPKKTTTKRPPVAKKTPLSVGGNSALPGKYEFLFSFLHDDIVTCASFSRDGRLLAAGSEKGTIILLDLATRKQRVIEGLYPSGNGVNVLSFSQDSQFLLTGGWGESHDQKTGLIKILRASDYTVVATLDAHHGHSVDFLRLSTDDNWLISADDSTINVWDFKERRVKWHFPRLDSGLAFDGERTLVMGIGAIPDEPVDSNTSAFSGQRLEGGSIAFVDILDGKMTRVLRTVPSELIRKIAVSRAKGKLIALAQSQSGYFVHVIDGRTYRMIRSISVKPYQPDPGWRLLSLPHIDFELAGDYPVVVYNDRRVTHFIDYESGKVSDFDHRSSVGFIFNHTGDRFAILGGIKNEALTGDAEQDYWTVSVFSFIPLAGLATNKLKTLEPGAQPANTTTNPGSNNPGPTKSSSPNSTSSKIAMPPNAPASLRSFDFVTATLDGSGNLRSRDRKSAYAYTEDVGGGVKLDMVAIPPGEFMMGSPESEASRSGDDGPQHRVRIGYWVYVGKFEITQAQWRAVMGTNPSAFKDCDECPVEGVSWDGAVEFCRKLSARTGREYRLPSEAEWEYAARAGTATPFAFGDTITPEIVNYDGNSPYANAAKGLYRVKTVPAGSLGVANAFGLYDMHGNVWEWCQDWYHDSYSAISGDAPTDGRAWLSGGEQKYRVLRGGSWFLSASSTRSAGRFRYTPDNRRDDFGFRVVVVR